MSKARINIRTHRNFIGVKRRNRYRYSCHGIRRTKLLSPTETCVRNRAIVQKFRQKYRVIGMKHCKNAIPSRHEPAARFSFQATLTLLR